MILLSPSMHMPAGLRQGGLRDMLVRADCMDVVGFKPWVGGVRRITAPLTGYDLSPDGTCLALWGRRDAADGRGPGTLVSCLDLRTGRTGETSVLLPGDTPVLDLRFTAPDTLWVLRADTTAQHAIVRVHAIPDGGVLGRHDLAGVGPSGALQWAPGGGRVLVHHDLGPWEDADTRDAVAWHLFDTHSLDLVARLNPYALWAWQHATGDTLDLAPWRALRAHLCPDGQRVAVRVDSLTPGADGALVLLDGLDRRGVAFAGKAAPQGLSLVWLGPTRVAELATGRGSGLVLHLSDAGDAYDSRDLPATAEGWRGPWTPDRASVSLSPDGRRLLVSAWRYAGGPCWLGIVPVDSRARDLPLTPVEASHPRSFAACWLDDETVALVLEGAPGRVRVVRYDPVGRQVLGQRTVPFGEGSELFRLRLLGASGTGVAPWLGLDWYDPTVGGWQLALIPTAALAG